MKKVIIAFCILVGMFIVMVAISAISNFGFDSKIGDRQWQDIPESVYAAENIRTDFFGGQKRSIKLRILDKGISGVRRSVNIPNDASLFTFKFYFEKGGDGDWIEVNFDDENGESLWWVFNGETAFGAQELFGEAYFLDSDIVGVRDHRGGKGHINIILHGKGAEPAEVLLTDFKFVQE